MKVRTLSLILATAMFTVAIAELAPQQLAVTIYKVSMVVTAALAGYWLDRALFPYARPHNAIAALTENSDLRLSAFNAATLRRAIIVAAAMIAVGQGA